MGAPFCAPISLALVVRRLLCPLPVLGTDAAGVGVVQQAFFNEMTTSEGATRCVYRRVAVYGDKEATERLIPFDIIPRVLSRSEWTRLEKGLVQRVTALNAFLADLYGKGEILKAGIVPSDIIYRNPAYRPEMAGRPVPHNIYVHIAGIDVVRVDENDFYVLEDNARTPSGVSYMLENREVMMRLAPDLFAACRVAPVETYSEHLRACLLLPPEAAAATRRSLFSPRANITRPITNIPSWLTS